MTSLSTVVAFREERRPSTLPAHKRDHTSMVANSHVGLLLLPMNVQSSSACSSLISKSRNIRWLKRLAAVEVRSSHRALVVREWPVTRAVAEMLTPSTRRLATWSNSLRAQRRPLYAVPVFVLNVPPQTVQRYRRRRPDFVANEPWPTMLRPGFPRLSHQDLAQAIPSIAFIAQVYRGETRGFAHDLGGEGDRSTANGASTERSTSSSRTKSSKGRVFPALFVLVGSGTDPLTVASATWSYCSMILGRQNGKRG